MRLFTILSFFFIITGQNAFASSSLLCSMVDKPETSQMKIDYEGIIPHKIFFKIPEPEGFKELNVEIEPVFERNEKQEESFSVKPIYDKEIDWDKEPECYKEIGTQWYFVFRHLQDDFLVQFTPYFKTAYTLCYLPRFQPQTHRLDCKEI